MRHLILMKLREDAGTPQDFAREIEPLFRGALEIEGVNRVRVIPACRAAANRCDVLIEMELTQEGLRRFDASEIHAEWKRRFGARLACKAIFDGE